MICFDESAHAYTVDGIPVPSVTQVCRFLSYDCKSDRPWLAKLAADRGSRVHAACAALDWGAEAEEAPDIAGYLTAYRRFLRDYRPDWTGIEYTAGSLSLGLAGTLDRFGYLCGRSAIVDLKTGARLYRPYLRAQLTGYRRLLAEAVPAFTSPLLYALQLTKEGTYTLLEVPPDDQLLDACIFLHRAVEGKPKKEARP